MTMIITLVIITDNTIMRNQLSIVINVIIVIILIIIVIGSSSISCSSSWPS